jgi:hypothetical protein
LERLEGAPGVEDVSLFGDRLHVVVDRPRRSEEVGDALEAGGFSPLELAAVTPSLEDVFIKVIRDADRRSGP